jgi:hypothetical protein
MPFQRPNCGDSAKGEVPKSFTAIEFGINHSRTPFAPLSSRTPPVRKHILAQAPKPSAYDTVALCLRLIRQSELVATKPHLKIRSLILTGERRPYETIPITFNALVEHAFARYGLSRQYIRPITSARPRAIVETIHAALYRIGRTGRSRLNAQPHAHACTSEQLR